MSEGEETNESVTLRRSLWLKGPGDYLILGPPETKDLTRVGLKT